MIRETGIYHLGSSDDRADIPFNEKAIDKYPFHPDHKGWPTRNRKKEQRRMKIEREIIGREVKNGVLDAIGERIKRMRDIGSNQNDGAGAGNSIDYGQDETRRRQERASKRRDAGERQKEKKRRIFGR